MINLGRVQVLDGGIGPGKKDEAEEFDAPTPAAAGSAPAWIPLPTWMVRSTSDLTYGGSLTASPFSYFLQ